MNRIFKTKEEFFLDMLEFYTQDTDRRCVDENNNCLYYLEGKEGCAIGRFLDKEVAQNLDRAELKIQTAINRNVAGIPEWMNGLEAVFLQDIQLFHDLDIYWDLTNKTLSNQGKQKVEKILRDYDISEEKFKNILNECKRRI